MSRDHCPYPKIDQVKTKSAIKSVHPLNNTIGKQGSIKCCVPELMRFEPIPEMSETQDLVG